MSIDAYRKLAGQEMMLADAVGQPGVPDIEFEPARAGGLVRPADLV